MKQNENKIIKLNYKLKIRPVFTKLKNYPLS